MVPVCQGDYFVGFISLLLAFDLFCCGFLKLSSESRQIRIQGLWERTAPELFPAQMGGSMVPELCSSTVLGLGSGFMECFCSFGDWGACGWGLWGHTLTTILLLMRLSRCCASASSASASATACLLGFTVQCTS